MEAKIEQGKQSSITVNLQAKQTVNQAQKEMYVVKVLDIAPEILSQPASTLSALIIASNYCTPEVAEKIILEYEQLTEQVIKQTDQEIQERQRIREYADKQCAEQLEKQRKIQVEHAEQCEKIQAKHYRKMNRLMKGLVRMEDEDEALDDYSAAPVDSESDDDLRKLATSAQKGHLKELSESQSESTVLSGPLQTRGGYSPRIRFDAQKSGTKPADIIQAENSSLASKDLASCVQF